MGRRSDHSREQLEALIVDAAHAHMAKVGFANFSARQVARDIGYSIGTIYNVFPSLDHLLIAINTRTFEYWADYLRSLLDEGQEDRITALVQAYFRFASEHRNLWMAIYDHRLPPGIEMPEADARQRAVLTDIVIKEIAGALPAEAADKAAPLARSLIATVHGHCTFALNGTFALMEEPDPLGQASARVHEAIRAAGGRDVEPEAASRP